MRWRQDHGVHPPPRLRISYATPLGADGGATRRASGRLALETRDPESRAAPGHESPFITPIPRRPLAPEAGAQERRGPLVPPGNPGDTNPLIHPGALDKGGQAI